jgi:hypothetical protein
MYAAGQHPVTFVGDSSGRWRVTRMTCIRGDALAAVTHIDVRNNLDPVPDAIFALRGVTSHARYVERREKGALDALSPPLGRVEATHAALIPIRKTAAWWSLPHDERRAIFETESRHITDCMPYLPRIARRLHHSRDLGEPFDFLTWFELAPEHMPAFDDLCAMLRSRAEWKFVDREVDIRLERLG